MIFNIPKNGASTFVKSETNLFANYVESGWICYMFGNKPGGCGITYRPRKGNVPNFFVRWMMKICFDCTWIKDKDVN